MTQLKIFNRYQFYLALIIASLCCFTVVAQQGDRTNDPQSDLPSDLTDFESPVLTPEEALASFQIQDGFRIELVASEPLIHDPVAIDFDEMGRIWVVEMRGFMPNVDGEGELDPVGRIVILEDTDSDGKMDKSTVFLDHLVLPRAISVTHGGALIIEPPDLLFFKDESGDGKADSMLHLYSGFGGLESPEHAGNGLLRGIDNWIYTSQHPLRFKFDGEQLITQQTPGHGQWGIAKDNQGRLFYTTNSDPLRADFYPLHYGSRNPSQKGLAGVNVRVLNDFRVWPSRTTPGINRGYQKGMLKDGKLTRYTSACGPTIYRGDIFPKEYTGNAFICEPAGNLIKRAIISENDGVLTARVAEVDTEFLASTDERFRPVNAYTGPDGALYVVDMYRGILQHRMFVTSFLRKQILERGLDKPLGLGRIYRIVPEDYEQSKIKDLTISSNKELVELLKDTNGWIRDTAQRLLIERKAFDQTSTLRNIIISDEDAITRLHALWTLEGLGILTLDNAVTACSDNDAVVRAAGIRMLEMWIDDEQFISTFKVRIRDSSPLVCTQATLSLGESQSPQAIDLMAQMMTRNTDNKQIRSAIISGLHDREIDFLTILLNKREWQLNSQAGREAIKEIAECILRSKSEKNITSLCELAAACESSVIWQANTILNVIASAQRLDSDRPHTLKLTRQPKGWNNLTGFNDQLISDRAKTIEKYLNWPGSDKAEILEGKPLTDEEQKRYSIGENLYKASCMSCHQENGEGKAGNAPTLVDTTWVLGSDERLIRILLQGMSGQIEIDGEVFNADMPRATFNSDKNIASMLTYIRNSWGNNADPISTERVREIRKATATRMQPWTVEELEKINSD